MAGRGRTYRGRAIGQAGSADLSLNLRGIKNWNLTDLLASNLLGRQELQNPHGTLTTGAQAHCRFSGVGRFYWRRSRQ